LSLGLGCFRMRLLIAVCCAVAWGGVACAEGRHADIQGVGAGSCAGYAEAYRLIPDETDLVYGSWAQGYITASPSITNCLKRFFSAASTIHG
jgi:hypothetical protein